MEIAKISYRTDEELEQKLISILQARGFRVEKRPLKIRTPGDLAKELGIRPNLLSERLKNYTGSFYARRGDSGRIIVLDVNPDLEEYLKK